MNKLIKENTLVSDIDLLTNKGLYKDKDYTNNYYLLYSNYHKLLDKYLVNILSLDTFDNKLANSELKFIPVKKEHMDYYQYISSMNLKYIYLRNNLYVEKLTKEDIDKIVSLSKEELDNPSDEIINIIACTYENIIDERNDEEDTILSNYGPNNDKYWFPSNELIIGIRYDDFSDNNLKGKEWLENNNKQKELLNRIMNDITTKGNEVLNININVIWYDDYTIKEVVNI